MHISNNLAAGKVFMIDKETGQETEIANVSKITALDVSDEEFFDEEYLEMLDNLKTANTCSFSCRVNITKKKVWYKRKKGKKYSLFHRFKEQSLLEYLNLK